MRHYRTILTMSIRAYYRNPQAIFFGLVFPLVIMIIFGLLNLGAPTKVEVGIVDNANNAASKAFIAGLQSVDAVTLHTGDSQQGELDLLNAGKRDLVAVIPAGLGGASSPAMTAYLNQARQEQAQVARAILDQVSAQASFKVGNITPKFAVNVQQLAGKNQTYTDFLVPGVIGMTVMQTGIFSIAFVVVRLKGAGVLRRLLATPMRKIDFLSAEVLTRLIMSVVQILLLLAVAVVVLNFHLDGGVISMIVVAALASAVFISMGFMISGVAKNEDSVPAIGNIIVLPMMFLSGVFFPTDSVPGWLRVISDRLPLTYTTDALRSIAVDGKNVFDVGGDILGLAVWLAITALAATRLFKWVDN